MPRPLRIEYVNAWYHVMNRGRRAENIFSDKKDYETFLAILQDLTEMHSLRVAAYCLMPNHYHLLVQTPAGNLSQAIQHINGVYTQRYNRKKDVDGQLFRGRYKSILVEESSYLLEVMRYIHRNPIRTGLCKTIDEYPWSSHHGYVSRSKKWDWLYRKFVLGMLTGKSGSIKSRYIEHVQGDDSSEIINFFSKKKLSPVLGSASFVERVKEKYCAEKKHDKVSEFRHRAPTIAEIKNMVSQLYGVTVNALEQSKRGQVNEARNLAIYIARKRSGLRLMDVGREFGLEKYSSVSSIVVRTDKQLSRSKKLQKMLKAVSKKLDKCQAKV